MPASRRAAARPGSACRRRGDHASRHPTADAPGRTPCYGRVSAFIHYAHAHSTALAAFGGIRYRRITWRKRVVDGCRSCGDRVEILRGGLRATDDRPLPLSQRLGTWLKDHRRLTFSSDPARQMAVHSKQNPSYDRRKRFPDNARREGYSGSCVEVQCDYG
jgi:hypothetical protein